MNAENQTLNQPEYARLGRAMYNFAVSNWILFFSSIILPSISTASLVIAFIEVDFSTTTEDGVIYNAFIGNLLIFLIPLIIWGIIFIYGIIRWFLYTIHLNKAERPTNNTHLHKAYKIEFFCIIITLAIPIVLIITVTDMILKVGKQVALGDSLHFFSANPLVFSMVCIFSALFGLIVLFIKIRSASRIHKWAMNQVEKNQIPSLLEMQEGTKFMRIGRICLVIPLIDIIGPFMYLYGLGKAGKNMKHFYS